MKLRLKRALHLVLKISGLENHLLQPRIPFQEITLVVRERKVGRGKSDLGIWVRLLIREEKSGNKLSSPPPPGTQWANQQAEFRSLIQWHHPHLSAVATYLPAFPLVTEPIISLDHSFDHVEVGDEKVEVNICSSSVS